MRASIPPYLRSLWNLTAPLHEIAPSSQGQPFLSPLGMHLPLLAPAGADARWFEAAAAHAAAHLVFSTHRFDPARIGPIPHAVLGVLEDARVEWLACRELPGLRRLWLSFHTGALSDTPGFEELLRRLARSLLDPCWVDPHPWVIKARRMFYLDDSCDMLALPQAESLLHAATLLGNDIGQMRLQFNARLYRAAPCYRDDNAYLWQADPARADVTHDLSGSGSGGSAESGQQSAGDAAMFRFPEWDRLIGRYRSEWCTVLDAPPPAVMDLAAADRLMQESRSIPLPRLRERISRQPDGEAFDLDALVSAWIARRRAETPEQNIYLSDRRVPGTGATLLLIDASASSAQSFQGSDISILSVARAAALRCALAIDRAGGACAIHAFCSDGRHAVHYERIKDFAEPLDRAAVARLMGLRSRLSTRLGAALRHATHLAGTLVSASLRVLLLTDGQPRDIDIHDPHYLLEDARHAVRDAARRNVRVQCLALDRAALRSLERVFGGGQVAQLRNLESLPGALSSLAR
jgi:nitric oxide reductase NorD protein